jgi:hypothetical protein
MNANELAKKLEEYSNVNFFIDCTYEQYNEDRIFKIKAATMLRQQADRIGVLEANHKIQLEISNKQMDYIKHLEEGLESSLALNKAQAERQEK